jgi:ubiquinol oxidase
MISARVATRGSVASKRAAAQILKTYTRNAGLRPTFVIAQHAQLASHAQRTFSTSRNNSKINEFFEQKETEKVRRTPAAWEHPAYTVEQMNAVVVAHREARTWAEKFALYAVKFMRFGLDTATGYRHERAVALNAKDPEAARRKFGMTEEKYMIRNVFLESIAGVPGMVAGMIRHLHSMRRMKRDNGW